MLVVAEYRTGVTLIFLASCWESLSFASEFRHFCIFFSAFSLMTQYFYVLLEHSYLFFYFFSFFFVLFKFSSSSGSSCGGAFLQTKLRSLFVFNNLLNNYSVTMCQHELNYYQHQYYYHYYAFIIIIDGHFILNNSLFII